MSQSAFLIVSAALAALLLFVACCGSPAESGDGPVAEGGALPLIELSRGTQSGVAEQKTAIIRDEDSWRELWSMHVQGVLPTPPPPEIDFENDMVVAAFLGQRPTGGYGIVIEACTVQDGAVVIEAHEETPDPDMLTTQALTAPFHLCVVPRVEGEAELRLH